MAVRSARMPGGREAVRTWRKRKRRVGGLGVVGDGDGWRGTPLTRYLGLDARLVVGAEQLGLDGLHHTLETPAGT